MAFIKWLCIAAGGLVLVGMVGCLGAVGYVATAEAVPVTARDLEVGGTSLDGERDALLAACATALKPTPKGNDICECVAARAEDATSRFERLLMTATFEHKTPKLLRLGASLIKAGVDENDINRINTEGVARVDTVLKLCAARFR